MKTFQNNPDGFKAIQIKVLKITLPLAAAAMLIGLAPGLTNPESDQLNTLPFVILFALGAVGYGTIKGLNRQKKIFKTYVLTIDNDSIQREAFNTPTFKIAKADVAEILQGNNGNMLIRGRQRTDFIAISAQINDLDDLRVELAQVKEIKILSNPPLATKFSYLLVVAVLVTLAIVYLSTNKVLVAGSATILTLSLIWSLYEIQTSKNVDSKTKRGSWWTIIVILSVIAITYAKLKT